MFLSILFSCQISLSYKFLLVPLFSFVQVLFWVRIWCTCVLCSILYISKNEPFCKVKCASLYLKIASACQQGEGSLLATGSYDGQARIWSKDGMLKLLQFVRSCLLEIAAICC
jgi:WD40 repeat protein